MVDVFKVCMGTLELGKWELWSPPQRYHLPESKSAGPGSVCLSQSSQEKVGPSHCPWGLNLCPDLQRGQTAPGSHP